MTIYTPPWINEEAKEFNPGSEKPYTINIGANHPIIIDKLYGPLAASQVKVTLKYDNENDGDWVIEHFDLEKNDWVEKCRWDCQEGFSDNEDNIL